jgi:hypothetical protein
MRRDEVVELIPARLRDHSRGWGVPTQRPNLVDANWRPLQGEIFWYSLIIERGKRLKGAVDGALLGVSLSEFTELKARERHYHIEDVTADVRLVSGAPVPYESVLTFLPKDMEAPPAHARHAVRAEYWDQVSRGLRQLGLESQPDKPSDKELIEAYEANEFLERAYRDHEDRLCSFNERLEAYLDAQGAVWEEADAKVPIPTALRPVVLVRPVYDQVAHIAEGILRLATKALRLILSDSSIQRQSGYRQQDLELAQGSMRENRARGEDVPQIARVDMAYYQGTPTVFEVNSDSPGGMFHLDLLTPMLAEFCEEIGLEDQLDFTVCGQTGIAVAEALRTSWNRFFDRSGVTHASPRGIAIVEHNWREWRTKPEFLAFKTLLAQEFQTKVEVCEPDELSWEGDHLNYEGMPVDLIYKRVLWDDLRRKELHAAVIASAW